jgi:Lar family restriction alleviation protein
MDDQIKAAILDTLEPCPFCAGPAAPDFIVGASYVIRCNACRARTFYQGSAAAAVAAWNRRGVALPAQPAAAGFFTATGEVMFRPAPAGVGVHVKTWRERIGLGADFPLHMPNSVERAMVAEIAELRDICVAILGEQFNPDHRKTVKSHVNSASEQ